MNILVADDSVTMRRILELTFQGEDVRVTAVDSGEAAVRKASELNPDVVIADLSMGMDGYAVATAIKASPGLERTAVLVMASQKHPYDEERGKAAGVDDHVLKPFDTQHVIDRVKQILAKPRNAPAAGARAAAPAPSPAAAAADRQSRVGGKTIAFGKPPAAAPMAPAAAPRGSMPQAAPRPAPAAPVASAPMAAAVATAISAGSDMEHKLGGLGLSADQVQGVLALSRDVIEKIVWEIVPDLAETLIKEEIKRLTAG
ncbi:MAG TPA: response regulator [Polyangiales bacterium]